MMTTVSMSN